MRRGTRHLWWQLSLCVGLALCLSPAAARADANIKEPAYSGVPDGRAVVSTAQSYLGVPYVWGGQGQRGFDCSGLIEAVYKKHGYVLPRVSRQQALVGLSVKSTYNPGDLLFFSESPGSHRITHVAMSMGGTRFIHAALGKGHVTYDHLGERYYAQRLVGARRILALPPGRYATNKGLASANVAFDEPAQAASYVAAGQADPNKAAAGAQAEGAPSADMVVEHAGDLPTPLMQADAHVAGGASLEDPFGERLVLPEETGFGLRGGSLIEPGNGAALAGIDARFFGHGTGFRADVAFPLALKLHKQTDQVEGDAGRIGTVRQWGRLVRIVQLGQPDARVFFRISRTDAVTLGLGTLIRHYLPNATSYALGDALLVANAATLLARFSSEHVAVSASVDDIFLPNVTGVSFRVTPKKQGRVSLHLDWASDWRAPYRQGEGLDVILSGEQIHMLAVGPAVRLLDQKGVRLHAYAQLGTLLAALHPTTAAFGGHLGLIATFAKESGGPLAPVFTLRLEGRLHSARYRPNFFNFAYAQRREAMPFVDPTSGLSMEMSALNLLQAQRGQPPEGSALAELTAVVASRVQAGVSYEDGGGLSRRQLGPGFVPRSLTAFLGLTRLPLSRTGTRLLHLHLLWHTSERNRVWPLVSQALPGTFVSASGRADIFDWLDVGVAVKKPMGPKVRAPHLALVADASVHFAF